MSGTWLPSLMPPVWRKRKSSSTIDFSLVLRLVNYINNSQQQHQQKEIRWSSSTVSSVPIPSLTFCQVACDFFSPPPFLFFPFRTFLQFCSRQSLAAWQFYHTPSVHITARWNHCLKVGSHWDMACMLMTAQGGPLYPCRVGAKPPATVSHRSNSGRSACNHFTLYSADSRDTKKWLFLGVESWCM